MCHWKGHRCRLAIAPDMGSSTQYKPACWTKRRLYLSAMQRPLRVAVAGTGVIASCLSVARLRRLILPIQLRSPCAWT